MFGVHGQTLLLYSVLLTSQTVQVAMSGALFYRIKAIHMETYYRYRLDKMYILLQSIYQG